MPVRFKTFFVTIIALATPISGFAKGAEERIRKVEPKCQTYLMLNQNRSEMSFNQIVIHLGDLESLLLAYRTSNDYYRVPTGEAQNLPSLVGQKVGKIETLVQIFYFQDPEVMTQIKSLINALSREIYAPYALLQSSISVDPDSEAGEQLVYQRYLKSNEWLFNNGWASSDEQTPGKFLEIQELLASINWDPFSSERTSKSVHSVVKTLTNSGPRRSR